MTDTTTHLGLPMATAVEWKLLLHQTLEQLRQDRELTQAALASLAGLNVGTIGRIERGEVRGALHVRTLTQLARAFNCASLAQFWRHLKAAHESPTTKPGLHLDDRTRRVVLAFQELLPTQQDTVEAVVLWFRANVRAHRSGEEVMCNLDGLPAAQRRR